MTEIVKTMVTEPIKRRVRVNIEFEIDITLMPSMFGGKSVEQYLEEFRKGLWDVDDIDDVVRHAAHIASFNRDTEEDGIGTMSHESSDKDTNVKYRIVSEETESEIIGGDKL